MYTSKTQRSCCHSVNKRTLPSYSLSNTEQIHVVSSVANQRTAFMIEH